MRFLPLVTLVLLAPATFAEDAAYPIHFEVPRKVGGKRRIERTMVEASKRIVEQDGKVLKELKSNSKVELQAVVEVLEIDKAGQEIKVRVAVEKFAYIPEGSKSREALPPGSVFLAQTKDGKTIFSLQGKDAKFPQLAEQLLPQAVSTAKPGPTQDMVFGTRRPQPIGAVWRADQKLLAEQFKALNANTDDLVGFGKLLAVQTVNDRKCLEVEASVRVKGIGPAGGNLVPEQTEIEASDRILIPMDYSTGPLEQRVTVKVRQILKGKANTPQRGRAIQVHSTSTTTTKITYLSE